MVDRESPPERPQPRLSHRLEMVGIHVAATVVRLLPLRLAIGLMGFLGTVAGSVFRVRRQTVDANLELAFPDVSASTRGAIARGAYRHLAVQSGLLFRMLKDDDALATLTSRVVLADDDTPKVVQWLQERHRQGQGTLVLMGHFGNWEVGASCIAHLGIPVRGVAATQSNPGFDQLIQGLRERLSLDIVRREEATSAVPQALASGTAVALVADQFTWSGMPILFFGQPTMGAKGPAVFARRSRAAVVLLTLVADRKDPSSYTLHLKHLDVEPNTKGREVTRALTQSYFDALEAAIREHPEQYLWHHRRWRPLENDVSRTELEHLAVEQARRAELQATG